MQKKTAQKHLNGFNLYCLGDTPRYIISGIPHRIGIAGSALFTSVITHSTVNNIPETEATFQG